MTEEKNFLLIVYQQVKHVSFRKESDTKWDYILSIGYNSRFLSPSKDTTNGGLNKTLGAAPFDIID